ncbi:aldose epimerase family protein [Persicitalea jodogahamensis]|uniref:Aldose 1-epimerase n=1 Tax=Persicitalea jodogahamensis TaxID=402147 RepID=A0A8J3D879_9BACT|nr:aldose epimerase family protein [Persicitalea jodogahamensis]GHB60117.1 aldose 1-epimerase [Persicitalea jodogahamensis]
MTTKLAQLKPLRKLMPIMVLALLGAVLTNCETKNEENQDMESTITKEAFGTSGDGEAVDLYTLTNANGMVVQITNYGGIITKWMAPDKDGQMADVVLGFDSLSNYVAGHPFFGALVGRYGNRIAKGEFKLDGETYNTLVKNNGPNHLHGGTKGFDKKVWQAEEMKEGSTVGLKLTTTSADMEEGYPGKLDVTVTYTLTNDGELKIDYQATTDKPTVVNLTNHCYFNLTGLKRDVLDHVVKINSDSLVAVDATLIPTGKLISVTGTAFDFREPTPIGARIDDESDEQIKMGGGYDHCWVIDRVGNNMALAATVYEPTSGRVLEVSTTEPGVQFYTGNFLDGKLSGKGATYSKRMGFCLETEHYPDSPNQPQFPSVTLRPGETYSTSTVFKMSVRK